MPDCSQIEFGATNTAHTPLGLEVAALFKPRIYNLPDGLILRRNGAFSFSEGYYNAKGFLVDCIWGMLHDNHHTFPESARLGRKSGIHSSLLMEYINVETDNDGD